MSRGCFNCGTPWANESEFDGRIYCDRCVAFPRARAAVRIRGILSILTPDEIADALMGCGYCFHCGIDLRNPKTGARRNCQCMNDE